MAIVMLIGTVDAGEPAVGTQSVRQLSDLGVTRLAVLREGDSTAVVLEGWAFDPVNGEAAARLLFPGLGAAVRTFRQIADVGLGQR